jgi:hypothetical protein
LNPECSELQDFFKFIIVQWGEPFFEIGLEDKENIQKHFEEMKQGHEVALNDTTGKYQKVDE